MTVYSVLGMSCQHCVNSVTTEVSAVPGVESVEVDLAAATVTVTGGEDAAVRAAIDEAGYEVAA
jgi:copper chaperone CopZ